MALNWTQLAKEEPLEGVDLWIRIYWYFGYAILAQYNGTTQEFTTNLVGLVIPGWAVSRWSYPEGYTPVTDEPEVTQYIDGLATPLSSTQITRLNTLVAGYKSDLGIATLDELFYAVYVFRGETEESSLKNLVQDLYHNSKVNSPAWTQWQGFKGNGTNAGLAPGFNPNAYVEDGIQNDFAMGVESTQDLEDDMNVIEGHDGTRYNRLSVDYLSNTGGGINCGGGGFIEVAHTTTAGQFWISRTGASTQILTRDATLLGSGGASNGVPNVNIRFLTNGGATAGSSAELGFGFFTKGLTQSQINLIRAINQDYINSLP